ncbi:MAG: SDR family NAD(P)-dependent oxidoreductase [Symploca sp. SIO2D2]|nr:SDR family NAD(P)-dependent oxidoreductase [Symploca sp. SIO2D2]
MELRGKRIVITGCTSGIGLEMVRQLHAANKVIGVSRSEEKLERLSREFGSIDIFSGDLACKADLEAVADSISRHYDSIDLLINNAAIQNAERFDSEDFCYDSIGPEIELNFTAVCRLCYLLLPLLNKESRSIIANVNSGLGLAAKTSSAVYCGTKGALDLFSQSLGYQLEQTNVKVLQGFLPLVDTPMTKGRGSGKMKAEDAVEGILKGVEQELSRCYIGKVGLLNFLLRLTPSLARKIMKKI